MEYIVNEIICPHCKKAFTIDEAGFADIVQQVRNHEFNKELHERLALLEKEKENAVKLAEQKAQNALIAESAKKDAELAKLKADAEAKITRMQAKLENTETEKKLALTDAVHAIEKQRDDLVNQLKSKDHEAQLLKASLKDKYESELKSKDEMIAYYKDMKAKLSTKMVGETLEQHCETEFNRLRATAFQNAYFE